MREIIRNIIYSDNAAHCCLCFLNIEDNYYSLQDEITTENEVIIEIQELVSVVLGKDILDALSTNILCPNCVATTLNIYKFLEQCKNNVFSLSQNFEFLHKYINNEVDSIDDNVIKQKRMVLAINTNDQHNNVLQTQLNSFDKDQKLIFTNIKIDIENESNENVTEDSVVEFDTTANEKRQKKKGIRKRTANFTNQDYVILDENQYKCAKCPKSYPSVFRVRTHYLRVHAPKVYKCPHCPSSLGTHHFLNDHIRDTHGTKTRQLCSHCGKIFQNPRALKQHEKSHSQHCMTCHACGKVYKGQKAFNNHIEQKLCDKERKCNKYEAKFICDYCGKRYTRKVGLTVHIRVEHTDGKSVKCNFCDKKLSSMSRLKDHILTHTKEKNFECNICGGKFVSKPSLLYHTRIHTGEKPYKCDLCDERFLSASRRSQHNNKHHYESVFECDICHIKLKCPSGLSKHRKIHFNVSSRLYLKEQSQNKTVAG